LRSVMRVRKRGKRHNNAKTSQRIADKKESRLQNVKKRLRGREGKEWSEKARDGSKKEKKNGNGPILPKNRVERGDTGEPDTETRGVTLSKGRRGKKRSRTKRNAFRWKQLRNKTTREKRIKSP